MIPDLTRKYYTTGELRDKGLSYYKINCLVKAGRLRNINRSAYENLGFDGDENDFYTAQAYVPSGIICLMSAARYYDLTTFIPDAVDVAIDRGRKPMSLPDWPEVSIHYFAPLRMETGKIEVNESGGGFKIFDIEKTVTDIVYYRNKAGIEETSEVIRNYLKRKDRNIDKRYYYSKMLRCEKTLRSYLEVLLV